MTFYSTIFLGTYPVINTGMGKFDCYQHAASFVFPSNYNQFSTIQKLYLLDIFNSPQVYT